MKTVSAIGRMAFVLGLAAVCLMGFVGMMNALTTTPSVGVAAVAAVIGAINAVGFVMNVGVLVMEFGNVRN